MVFEPKRRMRFELVLDTAWETALRQRGFTYTDDALECAGLQVQQLGHWLILVEAGGREADFSLEQGLTAPGWWKPVRRRGRVCRVFQMDTGWFENWDEGSPEELERLDKGAVLDWALATRSGALPPGWQPPAPDQVQGWLAAGALTLALRGLVRQGEMICRPDRWAVRLPLVAEWPASLPAARRAALEELVHDAQSRWPLVRFGLGEGPTGTALWGAVDLTGAPPGQQILSVSVEALRDAVRWLAETAEALADVTVDIPSLTPGCN